MTIPRDIRELRKQGKIPSFCSSVTSEGLEEILQLLRDGNNTEAENLMILATVSNILLVNRQLHKSYFTPNCSNSVLKDLIESARVGITREFKRLEDPTSIPENFSYDRTAVYRLVFLILYDGKGYLDQKLLEQTHGVLVDAFKISKIVLPNNWGTQAFLTLFNEISKGLSTMLHKYEERDPVKSVSAADCIDAFDQLLTLGESCGKNFSHHENMLSRSILNMYVVLTSKNGFNSKLDGKFPPFEVSDIPHKVRVLTSVVTYSAQQLDVFKRQDPCVIGGSGVFFVELSDIMSLVAITKLNFIDLLEYIAKVSANGDKDNELPVLMEYHKWWNENFYPVEGGENTIFSLFYELTLLSSPTNDKARLDDSAYYSQIKSLILDGYFELCLPLHRSLNQNQRNRIQLEKFLSLFGLSMSMSYLQSKGIQIPDDMYVNKKYFETNPKFVPPRLRSRQDNDESSMGIFNSLFSKTSYGGDNTSTYLTPSVPASPTSNPMTEEEKELEAEKLFTLLTRVEKNPSFKNFKNPIREFQQSGKFENLSLNDEVDV
ncbi:hypothetical protein CAAN1_05S05974 [[Candida] anglica]|uniref:Uncharacterized protein n=1 Tax=[Candida] anglica TaxID=148631 RepID=A0ABP0ED78_9ASCO